MLDQQERPPSTEHEGEQKHQIIRGDQTDETLKRYGKHAIEDSKRVKGEIDPNGIKEVSAIKRIGAQVHQSVLYPPEVPGQRGSINPITGHICRELRYQR